MAGGTRRLAPVVFVVALGSIAACGSDDGGGASDPNAVAGTITVFAAASLSGAFESVGEAFESANPDVTVVFNFAASSELAAQIIEGAPADVFASADLINMTKLADAGLVGSAAVTAGPPTVFATNSSEIVVAPGNPLGIAGVADLVDPDLILVTCAPEVPCGTYADQIFRNASITVTPDSYEENVNAVVSKVVLGEADAGIAYATDVNAAGDDVSGVGIPSDINVVAEYPIAVTGDAPNPTAAVALVEFVFAERAQQILNDFGFESP